MATRRSWTTCNGSRQRLAPANRRAQGVPTHDELRRFLADYSRLTETQRAAFLSALRLFIAGLRSRQFDPRLRIKRVQGQVGVWEMTWAPDGRATFQYGDEVQPGEPHVIWRRVGTHDIFRDP
jgi:hypothetical protein